MLSFRPRTSLFLNTDCIAGDICLDLSPWHKQLGRKITNSSMGGGGSSGEFLFLYIAHSHVFPGGDCNCEHCEESCALLDVEAVMLAMAEQGW